MSKKKEKLKNINIFNDGLPRIHVMYCCIVCPLEGFPGSKILEKDMEKRLRRYAKQEERFL